MNHFLILHSTGLLLYVFMHNIPIFVPKSEKMKGKLVYIFLLVLGDQRKYSEKSEICVCLDPCILNRFSLFGPHLD